MDKIEPVDINALLDEAIAMSRRIVSWMLGHRDPRSTRRYAEITEDHVRIALGQKQIR